MSGIEEVLLFISEEVDRRITQNYEKVFTINLKPNDPLAQPMLQWFQMSDTIPLFEYTGHAQKVTYLVVLYLNIEDLSIDVICTPIDYRGRGA